MIPTQEALSDLKEQIARRFNKTTWEELQDLLSKSEWLSVGPYSVHPSNVRVVDAAPACGRHFFASKLDAIVVVEKDESGDKPAQEVIAHHNLEIMHRTSHEDVTFNVYRKVRAECPAFLVTIHSAEGMTLYNV